MQGAGTDWRWSYAEMQQIKENHEPKPLSEGNLWQHTEIFIMLPLGIITVGELSEGTPAACIRTPLQQTWPVFVLSAKMQQLPSQLRPLTICFDSTDMQGYALQGRRHPSSMHHLTKQGFWTLSSLC